jgi:Ribbon-helix-helix protein
MMTRPRRDNRFVFLLTQAEKQLLKKYAIEQDLTVSQILRRAMRDILATMQSQKVNP